MSWASSKRRKFEVKTFYHTLHLIGIPFSCKYISRVAFFVWTATSAKTPTMDKLRMRKSLIIAWSCMRKEEWGMNGLFVAALRSC